MNVDAVVFAKLSLQRALLGFVSGKVRAVVFSLEESSLDIRFYVDGDISENDVELSSCVEAEVIADYSPEYEVAAKCLRIDYPALIEDCGVWVFQRQEPPVE
ncbi:hypothetical protein [Stutzerimonas nitrititolerans]|uniref:hypothetical protein n=1 Tax=Stutzerimonas nitrititolerans TaxID=2482751 RepID=UPI00289A4560|nr:hypothetical protein [Stutzerimonas nitrititolerans]